MTWNQIWEGVWPEIKSEGKRLFWEFLFNFSITVKTCNYISYLNHFKGPVTGNNTLIELSNCQSLISFTLLLLELKLYLVNTSPFLRSPSFDCADDFMASGNIWRVLFCCVVFLFLFCFAIRYIGLKVYVCFNSSLDFLAFLNWVIFHCIDIALFSFLLIDQCLLEFRPQFIYCEYFCNKHRRTCLLETLLSILLTKKFGVWQLKRILTIKLEVFLP